MACIPWQKILRCNNAIGTMCMCKFHFLLAFLNDPQTMAAVDLSLLSCKPHPPVHLVG